MPPIPRRDRNRLLAWQRLQRGWSYEELTAQIRRSMVASGETDTGLNANTVRRWETGERWPEPRYRKHLVLIFEMPAADLGLLTPDELQLRPADACTDLERLTDVATDQPGLDRATVLRGLAGLVTLPGLLPLMSLDGHTATHASTTIEAAEAYAQVTRRHSQLYWTCPPKAFFEPVYAHAQLGVGMLRDCPAAARPIVAAALAETAMLAGRLAFFDLHQAALAGRCLDVALAACREAGDHALATTILGHMAFIPAVSKDHAAARNLLKAASQHTWHGVDPTVRSWLHCVASELDARAGVSGDARRHADLALNVDLDNATPPAWMDFYDRSRRHAFAGFTALTTDAHGDAEFHLTQCLDTLSGHAGKQRSVVLADLAAVHANDPDRSADYLHRALDALGDAWYGTGLDRIRQRRAALGDSQLGAGLDSRIDAASVGGHPSIPLR